MYIYISIYRVDLKQLFKRSINLFKSQHSSIVFCLQWRRHCLLYSIFEFLLNSQTLATLTGRWEELEVTYNHLYCVLKTNREYI